MEESYSKLVDIAYNMHTSGKYEEAKDVYEKLISINPDDLDVLNLYAQLNVSLKNYDLAIKLFMQVYEKTQIDEILLNVAKVYFNIQDYDNAIKTLNKMKEIDIDSLRILGLAYLKSNRYKESINTYTKIYLNGNSSFNDLLNLSIAYKNTNDIENSLKYGINAFNIDNNNYETNMHLASLYQRLNDKENELKHLLNAIKKNPNVDIAYRIGVLYKNLENDEMAVEYFNAILEVNPNDKKTLQNIAMIYLNHDKKVSLEIFNKILETSPDDENTMVQLYITYRQMLDYQSAYINAKKLTEKFPNNIEYKTFLGDELINLGKYQEALEVFNNIIKIEPEHVYANMQIGYIYEITDRSQEAIEIFKKYIDPEGINQDLLFTSLKEKNIQDVREYLHRHLNTNKSKEDKDSKKSIFIYKLGLDKKYNVNEHMLRNAGNSKNLREEIVDLYRNKSWHFKDISGQRILIYSNNGVGDSFMFCRYIKDVQKIASEVLLEVPKSCYDLFKHNFPNLKVFEACKKAVDENLYDYTSSIFSILPNLNIDLHNIDSSPYFSVSEEEINEKSKFDFMKSNKKKVGFFWQGNPMIMPERSIKLEQLIPIINLDNIQAYSFQMTDFGDQDSELKKQLPLIDLVPYIKSYTDTAAFLKNIDVLVSIDTSIANLAGAMGIKTFLLLPYVSEWRWFHDTNKTPWYDSVRIFKQTTPLVWDDVVERIKHELEL